MMKNKTSNTKLYKKIINTKNGTFISEIQEFYKPEDYEDAFKRYYPKEK